MEKWVDIIGYEGLYQISNFGKIKSLSKKLKNRFGFYYGKEKILKSSIGYGGYRFQKLTSNGVEKMYSLHRLVAEHFLDKVDGKNIVNHKDLNKLNNCVDNLEWCTIRENVRHYQMNSEKYSKYVGVSFDKARNKWTSKIKINKKTFNIGRFNSEDEAYDAYNKYINDNNIDLNA